MDSTLATLLPPQFGEQLQGTFVALTGALVLFVIAVVVALLGWLVAVGLSRGLRALFVVLGIDGPVARLQARERARTVILPSRIAGYVSFWGAFLAACILALRVMGLDLVPSITARLQDVVPRVLTSALVLLGGIPIALAVARLLNALFPVSRSSRLRYQAFVSVLAGIVILLALEQLGLAAQLVIAVGVTAVGAAGLALALAFGLGCRDLARDLIVEYLRASESDSGTDRP
jgi:hypothetical protein